MFKVADRAIVLLLKFFKLFLSGIGKMMQAEVLITLPRSSQKHCSWFEKILAFRRTVLLKMQFALSVKLSLILMNVFAKGQMVRLYQQNAVMWVIHATHTKPEGGHVVPFWWKLWGQEQERHSCILGRFTALKRLLIHYKTLLTSQTSWKTMKSGEIVPPSCQTMFLETVLKEEFGKSFSMWMESPFLLYQITLLSCWTLTGFSPLFMVQNPFVSFTWL